MSVLMLLHFPSPATVQITSLLASQRTERLLAVSPDMAEFLAVAALREPVWALYASILDCSVAKTCMFDYLLGL
jgi:hypothetical protein